MNRKDRRAAARRIAKQQNLDPRMIPRIAAGLKEEPAEEPEEEVVTRGANGSRLARTPSGLWVARGAPGDERVH